MRCVKQKVTFMTCVKQKVTMHDMRETESYNVMCETESYNA